jgi:hypothetical protein
MAVDNLPEWASGLPILADWLKKMVDAIRANRVIVSGPGLASLQTPSGQRISRVDVPAIRYAEITADCPAYSEPSGVKTLGKGAGTIYALAYSTTGVATLVSTGATGVPVYNPGNAAITSGKRVQVHRMQGQWHVISEICPA